MAVKRPGCCNAQPGYSRAEQRQPSPAAMRASVVRTEMVRLPARTRERPFQRSYTETSGSGHEIGLHKNFSSVIMSSRRTYDLATAQDAGEAPGHDALNAAVAH
eukprot:6214566-Pleurochrysis_carterae.AAC.3